MRTSSGTGSNDVAARQARLAQDSSILRYDAISRNRVSVYLRASDFGRDHLLLRIDKVARVQWERGVGARIRLKITEESSAREIFRTVNSGGSFGASSLRPHIGVGKAAAIDSLEIRWPGSGLVQRFSGPIAADKVYEIREGRDVLKSIQ